VISDRVNPPLTTRDLMPPEDAMSEENNVPNLDCLDTETLLAFWGLYNEPSRSEAVNLVGERPDAEEQARKLATYASLKACAMALRASGQIARATTHEDACDRIYNALPEDLRW